MLQAANSHHLLDEKKYLVSMKKLLISHGADARENKVVPDRLADDHWLLWFT